MRATPPGLTKQIVVIAKAPPGIGRYLSTNETIGTGRSGEKTMSDSAARLDLEASPAPTALVKDISGLVSPPDVCMRIFELLQLAL